jgi:hypothetical protein
VNPHFYRLRKRGRREGTRRSQKDDGEMRKGLLNARPSRQQ